MRWDVVTERPCSADAALCIQGTLQIKDLFFESLDGSLLTNDDAIELLEKIFLVGVADFKINHSFFDHSWPLWSELP